VGIFIHERGQLGHDRSRAHPQARVDRGERRRLRRALQWQLVGRIFLSHAAPEDRQWMWTPADGRRGPHTDPQVRPNAPRPPHPRGRAYPAQAKGDKPGRGLELSGVCRGDNRESLKRTFCACATQLRSQPCFNLIIRSSIAAPRYRIQFPAGKSLGCRAPNAIFVLVASPTRNVPYAQCL
jgi:hypothetical protein